MDLDGLTIKPVEGKALVKFVDDDDDEDGGPSSSPDGSPDYEGVLAIVMAVGAKVPAKVGDAVVLRPWARNGICIGDGVLIDAYDILGTVK